ncbi:CpcT/CpeT family chromophore lyase [Phormidesmis priestleyi]
MPSLLTTLAAHLTGEFDNREQAIADPVWYVHLRLWHCQVALFAEDSVTVFAEQANALKLDQPYRQRLLRIQETNEVQFPLRVQYYSFKDYGAVKGAGQKPALLQQITEADIELLPDCVLQVAHQPSEGSDRFRATPPVDACYFSYEGETRQVSLGFEVSPGKFLSYDKGIDPNTGAALWGAIMGAYEFTKRPN